MRNNWLLSFIAVATVLVVALAARGDGPNETKEQRDARMAWFREARFGLFIHWGIYSVPAGEWKGNKDHAEWILDTAKIPASQYEQFTKQFNPTKFDAHKWVRAAKEAGMKYIVITSKHHDGFSMFDTKLTDYNIVKATPFAHDPMKDLAAACKEEGITFCFYHSIMDWHHPRYAPRRADNDTATGEPNMDRYVDHMKGQLRELLTNYGPIGIIWFDGNWQDTWTPARGQDLYDYVRALDPKVIVNNRVSKSVGAKPPPGLREVGDYGTPEQEVPATGIGTDWETCMTMNDHWGYNKADNHWKSSQQLIRTLIDINSKGGNYLLNIGPTAKGEFPPSSLERLRDIGTWMKTNGEAIYGTTASPFRKLPWGRATRKGDKLYLHVFDWPANGQLLVPIVTPVNRAYLLSDPSKTLTTASSSTGTLIDVPATAPDPIASVVVLEISGEPATLMPPPIQQKPDGTILLAAEEADITGTAHLETFGGKPSIGFWTHIEDTVSWNFAVATPGKFTLVLTYACQPNSAGSEFVVSVGDQAVTNTIVATKAWSDFTTIQIGTLKIDNTGTHVLKVQARNKPGDGVMNLRNIELRPQ